MVAAAAGVAASVASVAGSVAGATKSGGATNTGASSSAPWEAQQPYIKGAYTDAQSIYNNALQIPVPQTYVAQQNTNQAAADREMFGFGMDSTNLARPWEANGQTMAGYAPAQAATAAGLASNGIGAQSPATNMLASYAQTGMMPGAAAVDPRLSSSITQAGMSGLGSLGAGAGLAQQAGQMALNPNGTVNAATAGGTALSSNPGLDAAIVAANRDVGRSLTENTLPQMQAAAMQSGNANSSREGAMEAIATRGASDQMADTAAQMRLGAYTQGANLGATGYNSGLGTAVSAGNSLTSNGSTAGSLLNTQQGLQQNQNQFGVSSRLSAANNAASQDLGYQTAQFQAQLAGNNQFGQAIQNGFSNQVNAQTSGIAGLNAAYTGASNDQAANQAAINQSLAQYNANTTDAQSILNNYWKIVGAGMGSSSTTTATSQPNNGGFGGALAGGIGGAAAGYGAFKNLTGNADPFGLKNSFGVTSASYDPSTYGWGSDGYNGGGTQSAGASTLQQMGFYNPLPTS